MQAIGEDRGAVAVVVALTLTMVMGMLALAVDAGQLWTQRRALVKATDAAALDAAQEGAREGARAGSPAACGVVAARLADNARTDNSGCTVGTSGAASWVRVTAERSVQFSFAPVIGVDGSTVTSATTARWGAPTGAAGVRPVGVCRNHEDLRGWLDDGSERTIRLTLAIAPEAAQPCAGPAAQQLVVVDLGAGNAGSSQLRAWLSAGTTGQVAVGRPVTDASGLLDDVSNDLRDLEGSDVLLPVLQADGGAYRVEHFLGGVVTEVAEGPGGFLDLQPVVTLVEADCCSPWDFADSPVLPVATIGLCAVDDMDPGVRCRP